MPRKQDLELEFQLSKQKQEHELRLKTLELEHEKEILELRVQLEKANSTPGAHSTGMPKIKLQPFNQEKDDILCYLSEFDVVAEHAGWTENSKALQLRRPADYFQFLEEIKRRPGETYRGLMSRIDLYLSRFIDEKDPVQKFREEYFLKALSPQQAQWIRRNKGSSELVEAAEDYILPTKSAEDRKLQNPKVLGEKKSQEQGNSGKQKSLEKVKCFSCGNFGHYANKCPKKGNLASCFVKGALWGLHYVPGKVDDVEVSTVKDTGASMTLLREDLVDPKCVLHGQTTSLVTAIGQPFEAKLAVVNLETPMFKGHVQVGLVPDLVADGLLGIDVLERNKVAAVVTRAKAKEQEQNEVSAKNRMNKCDVVPRDLNVVVTNDEAGEVNLDLPDISLEKLSVVDGNRLLAATENEIGIEQQFPNDTTETISDLVFGHGLTQVQRQSLRDVCQKFSRIFTSKPGKCDVISHTIKTTSENPITQRPYRIPEAKKQEVKESLNEMLEQGLITPSKSPWASPIVLVNKPDGTIRICVDYRKLNEITLTDPYPIPRMSDIFEKIGSAKYLSRFDLTKGYWQVPLAKETREKSAFITPFGLFEFTVMPFGMKTSPASFIRLMDRILDGTQNTVAYFDDIIVYSQTWEDHIKHVTELLQRIYEANLTIRPSKCKLGAAEIICLGHIVGGGTIRPDPRKLKAMEDFPLPLTKKELRSFLGLTGYYRQYIGSYADITVPLTDLLRKSQPTELKWTEREVQSFKKLKEALMTAPVLVNPNFNLPFVLQTDASNNAIGAVLSQQLPDGDHPVAYLSKKLLPREKNYSTIEKELLAIVWAIGSFSNYSKLQTAVICLCDKVLTAH
ncbi:uncharacterized protein LOC134248532 [Saccostrea cucullata]|uniref:uncharacterized protein LOC134248532 n=1 Tax=Saccostrea cuccullata TaxID=36930 RepID=UPI002ED0656F